MDSKGLPRTVACVHAPMLVAVERLPQENQPHMRAQIEDSMAIGIKVKGHQWGENNDIAV